MSAAASGSTPLVSRSLAVCTDGSPDDGVDEREFEEALSSLRSGTYRYEETWSPAYVDDDKSELLSWPSPHQEQRVQRSVSRSGRTQLCSDAEEEPPTAQEQTVLRP